MTGTARATPRQVAVVGGGVIGLSTAWFLQEAGVQVTLYERDRVLAGASWGNAGWITPALTVPLPGPAVLRFGLRAVVDPRSPVYVPPKADRTLLRFLSSFVAHSTPGRVRRGIAAYVPLNAQALEAFDVLAAGGVEVRPRPAEPFLACFRRPEEAAGILAELEHLEHAGQQGLEHRSLPGWRGRAEEPALSDDVGEVVKIYGQRYIRPPEFGASLAAAVRTRGAEIVEGARVTDLLDGPRDVTVVTAAGERHRHDAVVIATGAWFDVLARRFGVRRPVVAGRGYSFSVPADPMPHGPLYFPVQRVACTPLGDRLRVAGMMEFRGADEPLDRRRIAAIANAVRPFLRGADLDDRQDEWVGSRPCTADGLPLIGPTASPRVFAAGGHGMWGITLGPVTGRLLADAVLKGETPAELAPFDPLR